MRCQPSISIVSLWLVGIGMAMLVVIAGPRAAKDRPENFRRESQMLIAPDAAADDHFGAAVALAGPWALVGAPLNDYPHSATGSAYLYHARGDKWNVAKLSPSVANGGAMFGWSVALNGSTAFIGAPEDMDQGKETGAAFVFTTDANGTWHQTTRLTASDAAANDRFGHSVALSGDFAIVGAPFANDGAGMPTCSGTAAAVSGLKLLASSSTT